MAKKNIYDTITQQIITLLEQGEGNGEWQMPWQQLTAHGWPKNALTGKQYNGANVLALWAVAEQRGYTSNEWATFKQWKELGAKVKKGAKAARAIAYNVYEKECEDTGEADTRVFARSFALFNAYEVEGYTKEDDDACVAPSSLATRTAYVERFVVNCGADIREENDQAFYDMKSDAITIPDILQFRDSKHSTATENYYSTLLHELVHYTGATHRLDRLQGIKRGDDHYAFEELVAEIGSAMLCAHLGITVEPRMDYAQYIHYWLGRMKGDSKYVV